MRVVLEHLVHIRFRQAAGFRERSDLAARYPLMPPCDRTHRVRSRLHTGPPHWCLPTPALCDRRQEPPFPEFLKARRRFPTHTAAAGRVPQSPRRSREPEASPSSFPNVLMRPWLKRLRALGGADPYRAIALLEDGPDGGHQVATCGGPPGLVRFAPRNQCSTPSSDPAHKVALAVRAARARSGRSKNRSWWCNGPNLPTGGNSRHPVASPQPDISAGVLGRWYGHIIAGQDLRAFERTTIR